MNVQIIPTPKYYKVVFPFHPVVLRMIKAIPGRRFIKHKSGEAYWTLPPGEKDKVEQFAKRIGATWISEDQALVQNLSCEIVKQQLPSLDIDIPVFSKTHGAGLYDFQKQGVAYGLRARRFINGDHMGLGKTGQAIATVEGLEVLAKDSALPCLIICPSSLKFNWQDEIHDWTDRKATILDDKSRHNFHLFHSLGLADYFIVNFESLKKYFVEEISRNKQGGFKLKDVHFKGSISMFKSVIIDEAHRLKDHTTQQAIFTKGICMGKENIMALTGTPVINKPKDLISQLGIIDRMVDMGGFTFFKQMYCAGYKEASNLTDLNNRLTSICFYRRTKDEVLKDLPAKSRQVVKCDITTRIEYNHAQADLVNYLKQYKQATDQDIRRKMRGEAMVRIGILKNISARGKIAAMVELTRDVIDSGEKLILFAHLKEVVAELKKHFPEAMSITGDDNTEARNQAKKRFQQDDDCRLIICSIKAAGVGLTLTASSRVAFIELPWTFADCEQCEDRAHRIGQKDNVTVSYLLGHKTIDEYIYQIILEKKSIAHQVTGTEDTVDENIVDAIADLFTQDKKIEL